MEYKSLFSAFQEAQGLLQAEEMTGAAYRELGQLMLTSGKLIACDPWFISKPFAVQPAEPGRYPVAIMVAHFANTDQRVALAGIFFRDTVPVRWDNAATTDVEHKPGKIYSYGVDSGTGCFMDEDAVEPFTTLIDESDSYDEDPLLLELMKPDHSVDTWSWADYCVNEQTGANIIAFSSGWGDGGYPSYFGYDSKDQVVCLITDFGVLYR